MKRIGKGMLIAGIGLFLWATSAGAGAWTQEKGAGYNRLAVNYYHSDENYVKDGDRVDYPANGEFKEYNLNYYGEYGLIDRLTLIGSIYYKELEKEDDFWKIRTEGVGDIDLALKYKLLENRIGVFSVQGLIKIPETYDEDRLLPLGSGQYDYEWRLLYGRSLWPLIPGYCNLETAYRWRTEDPSDEFRFLAEIGSDLGLGLYGRVKLDATFSAESGDREIDPTGNPTSTDDYDILKLDTALGYRISPEWGVEVGYVPSIYGQWTAAGTTWTAAVVYQTKYF